MSARRMPGRLAGWTLTRQDRGNGPASMPATGSRPLLGLRGVPPWSARQQLGLLATTGFGAAGLLGCWAGTARDIPWGQRLQWLTGAVVALIVAGVGDGLWLLHGHRAVRRQKQRLYRDLGATAARLRRGADAHRGATATDRCAGPTMTRYHRADCLLVAGKTVTWASAEEHLRDGRRPCAMCAS